jgi:mRNA interferase MazF
MGMVEPDPKICSDPCRFDIFLVALDPTKGSEIKKTRPCVIISPDEMNHSLSTILVAPMTTTLRSYPTRVFLTFNDKKGQIALDQMRTLDKSRLIKKLGRVSKSIQKKILQTLLCVFSE